MEWKFDDTSGSTEIWLHHVTLMDVTCLVVGGREEEREGGRKSSHVKILYCSEMKAIAYG